MAQILGRGGGNDQFARGRLTKPAADAFHEVEASLQ
jgi:hypothetical protein